LLPLVEGLHRDHPTIASWLLERQLAVAIKDDKSNESNASQREIKQNQKDRVKIITSLFKASRVAGQPEVYRKITEHVLTHPRLYPAIELAKLLRSQNFRWEADASNQWGHGELATQLKVQLEREVRAKREENDWSINEKIPCKCADCKALQAFLLKKDERTRTWPLAKDRRSHIHRTIDGMDIPVTHITHRTGSPQKLVLTKTTALFQKDKMRSEGAAEELKLLEALS
jgi:hypothetical protein